MKKKVILIEDNLSCCDAMQFLFEDLKEFDFLVFNEAKQFLNEYTSSWSGFLLIDLFMPELNGIELLKKLKLMNHRMYIIVMSGHADRATASKVKELGANEFLSKPISIPKLLSKIRSTNLALDDIPRHIQLV